MYLIHYIYIYTQLRTYLLLCSAGSYLGPIFSLSCFIKNYVLHLLFFFFLFTSGTIPNSPARNQPRKVATLADITAGTNTPATRSACLWIGALDIWASSTRRQSYGIYSKIYKNKKNNTANDTKVCKYRTVRIRSKYVVKKRNKTNRKRLPEARTKQKNVRVQTNVTIASLSCCMGFRVVWGIL